MKCLLAKTKGRNGDYLKVISNEDLFELPDNLENSINYSVECLLGEEDWFSIRNFSQQEYCIELLTKRFVPAEYNQIGRNDYSNIEFLCSYQAGKYYFQKMGQSSIVRKKYFTLSITPRLVINEPIIIVNNLPDAIYVKSEDVLYFKKLTSITSIFKGIEILYKEATEEETESFLENDFINLVENFSASKVKIQNRRRIAMAIETLQSFSEEDKISIFSYIREYCDDLEFNEAESNFSISNEEELKKLLYGIEQRYYTTLLGDEKRLANSIIRL